jgi:hypothetical protein
MNGLDETVYGSSKQPDLWIRKNNPIGRYTLWLTGPPKAPDE